MSDALPPLLIGKNDTIEAGLLPALGNRHGLITGATGTGKTVTLQRLAEQFSTIGVPVFMADVKGDLTGISQPGQMSPKLQARLEEHKLPTPQFTGFPVMLWDVFGKQGHPVRATVSDMGPLLLARMMGLNETQEGVLNLTFKVADDNGLLLLDSKDLRAMLQFIGENAKQFTNQYGNVSSASVGAIQRNLLTLEQQGAERFFGEPMLKLSDMMRTAPDGRGYINVLMADQLMNAPRLYGTFLLWLLAELFEQLPEVGDLPKPKMVFFFDEAHLLFDGAPKALLDKIEQVVRLIRSKGVGVYFITQNPLDVPDSVLGQLGNRVQHALRAFTPRDQKAVRTAAETMRANPALNTEQAIGELGVGEALVSFLDAKGTPAMVQRVWIATPASRIGPATAEERAALLKDSPVAGVYEEAIDRESAFEVLRDRAAGGAGAGASSTRTGTSGGSWYGEGQNGGASGMGAAAGASGAAGRDAGGSMGGAAGSAASAGGSAGAGDMDGWGNHGGTAGRAGAAQAGGQGQGASGGGADYGHAGAQTGAGSAASRRPGASSAGRAAPAPAQQPEESGGFFSDVLGSLLGGATGSRARSSRNDSVLESAAKSMARSVGSQVGRQLVRGILGSLTGKKR